LVEFKPRRLNVVVNALSRRTEEEEMAALALSSHTFEMFNQFHREAATLPELVPKHAAIEAGTTDKGWTIVSIVVLFQGRVFMPSSSSH
jgi:hypothetical protein